MADFGKLSQLCILLEDEIPHFQEYCAFWYKSMKIGMDVENCMLKKIRRGAILDFAYYGSHLGFQNGRHFRLFSECRPTFSMCIQMLYKRKVMYMVQFAKKMLLPV